METYLGVNMEGNLPKWFILQKAPNIDIKVAYWYKVARKRAHLLENFKIDAKQTINNLLKELRKPKVQEEYFLGSFLLILVAAKSARLRMWVVEKEGDLFKHLYEKIATGEEKKTIIHYLFGTENILTPARFKLKYYEDENESINSIEFRAKRRGKKVYCVRFHKVPFLVRTRRGYLRKGWVCAEEDDFLPDLKRTFQEQLQKRIQSAELRLGIIKEVDNIVNELVKELEQQVQLESSYSFNLPQNVKGDIFSKYEIFPPCMIFLIQLLKKEGYLEHQQRWQLGSFLKRLGMPLEAQLRFWYETAVDNVNITFEEFSRRGGYQIRHLYGLEGGRTDYDVPKCKTIIFGGYFCPFQHLNPKYLETFLKETYELNDPDKLHTVLSYSVDNRPILACSTLFSYKTNKKRKIYHPLQWVRFQLQIKE